MVNETHIERMNRSAGIPVPAWILAGEAAGLLWLAFAGGFVWCLPLAALVLVLGGVVAGGRLSVLGGLLSTLLCAGWWWLGRSGSDPTMVFGVSALLLGGLLGFMGILEADGNGPVNRGQKAVQCALKLLVAAHFLCGAVFLGSVSFGGGWHGWLAHGLAGAVVVLAVDLMRRLAARLFTPRRLWDELETPGAFFFYRWMGGPWRACLAPADNRDTTGLRLDAMWMWPQLRAALPGLLASVALVVWLATMVHEVGPAQSGVRRTLGRIDENVLMPGLRFSLPWPLGGVEKVDGAAVRECVLGFQSDPGAPILWERAHYEGEERSLVGAGDDFLSISVPIFYRVSDVVRLLRSAEEPERLLESAARRLLVRSSAHIPAGEIMTTLREEMRADLRRDLQAEMERMQTGIEVLQVCLRDVHPPVEVAPAFQEVVGAMEEKEGFIHDAEALRIGSLERARGSSVAARTAADSGAERRVLEARGQAARFASMAGAWARAPELYQWREGFRVFDDALGRAKKAVFDRDLDARMPAQIDLRRVLNPELVDLGGPKPETLVPRGAVSRDAFDLDIEGYLRMGSGEVPAVDLSPPDPDNLLQQEARPVRPPTPAATP